MPNPLKNVAPHISEVIFDPVKALTLRPAMATKLTMVMAAWANLDRQNGVLLSVLLGSTKAVATTGYYELKNVRAEQTALRMAGAFRLDADGRLYLEALLSLYDSCKKRRDRMAHWIWGYSKDLSDALLLIDPREVTEKGTLGFTTTFDQFFALALAAQQAAQAAQSGGQLVPFFDFSKIFVYRDSDFDSVLKDIAECSTAIWNFAAMHAPSMQPPPEPFPDVFGTHRDLVKAALEKLPSFQVALKAAKEKAHSA